MEENVRVQYVAAHIAQGARQICLRIGATWRWATPIAQAWQRLRDGPAVPKTFVIGTRLGGGSSWVMFDVLGDGGAHHFR